MILAVGLAVSGALIIGDRSVAQTKPVQTLIDFDIPAQPLADALGHYVAVTGHDAVYDTNLASGRRSSALRGAFAPDQALKRLLTGSGLAAEFVAATTFVLLPIPADQAAERRRRSSEHQRYYGLIQAGITNALCRLDQGRPGNYRFTTALWIAPDGAVKRTHRIGSTGAQDIDARVDAALRHVRLDQPPPADFLQPVLIVIVPQGPDVVRTCDLS